MHVDDGLGNVWQVRPSAVREGVTSERLDVPPRRGAAGRSSHHHIIILPPRPRGLRPEDIVRQAVGRRRDILAHADAEVEWRKLNLKAMIEGSPSYFSLKRSVPGGFNVGFTGSTCTVLPRQPACLPAAASFLLRAALPSCSRFHCARNTSLATGRTTSLATSCHAVMPFNSRSEGMACGGRRGRV